MSPHRDKGDRKKKWRVDYYAYVSGKRVRRKKYFKHKEAANEFERMEAEKDERRKAGLGYLEAKEFSEFANEFIARHLVGLSPDYVRVVKGRILNTIVPFFEGRRVHELFARDIEDFINVLRKKKINKQKIAGTTLHHYYTLLQTMFLKAVMWNYADDNPVAKVAKPKKVIKRVPSAKSDIELRRFLNECNEDIRYGVLILLHTGLRIGELIMLEKSDFDLEREVLILRSFEGHTTKSNKHRIVPLSRVVTEIISKMPSGPIVRMARKTFEKHFLKAARRANVDITPHELRHTYCSWMLAAGTPETTVQQFLGHQNSSMTKRYTHYVPGQFDNVKDKIVFGSDFVRDNSGTNVLKMAGIGGKKRND